MSIYPQQQPIGSPDDLYFNFQDYYNVFHEFPSSPGSYFANQDGKIICTPSMLNPAIQWCSTKPQGTLHIDPFAAGWTKPPVYVPVVVVPTPNPTPHPTVTPEPSMLWLLVLAVVIIAALRHIKGKAFLDV